MQYAFPEAALEPGEERKLSVDVTSIFRGQKITMIGFMKPIRGHFKIKRTLLPNLDRDDVVAYTRVYKYRRGEKIWFRPGKTVVEFSGFHNGVRAYLPTSVMYIHTDPLEYIRLRNVHIGALPQMPSFGEGCSALFFGSGVLGNGLCMDTAEDMSVSLLLKNEGDVQVRVRAMILGTGLA